MRTSRDSRVAMALGCALVACVVAACAPESRYRTLSFLFDGVPAPSGMAVDFPIGEAEEGRPAYRTIFNGGLSLAAKGEIPAPKVVFKSIHKPVAENRCLECHDPSIGFDKMPAHDAGLCDKCHLEQRQREGWDHGPINLGACIPCHVAHESPNEHLLSKPVPDLCLTCHKEDLERPETYHDVPNIDECVACHNPHRMY